MNWDDLRVFLAVARAESLTGAGQVLRMDPATVGRRVARLEEGLGRALFARSPRGYALTDLGARLRDHAVQAEAALDAALDEGQGAAGLTGTVRIGAPDGCANFLLPQVVARLAEQNPGLDIQVLAAPRVVNLSRREADLAITVSPPKTGRLAVQRITGYRLHLATHRDWAAGDPLDYLGELGLHRVALASNSVAVQLQMLRQGGAAGIVHDFALPFAPELVRVLTDRVSLGRAFYLVRDTADRRSDRMNRLAEALVAGLRAEVARLERLVAEDQP
jgi:DNA-binding transcriptional LysR family regulator